MEDIITTPPEPDPYDRLKEELILRLSTSKEHCVRQLLTHEEMGDRRSSQFLRNLKSLPPDVPDNILRIIWTKRLPPHTQVILAGRPDDSLDSASRVADKIPEVTLPTNAASISANTPDSTAIY